MKKILLFAVLFPLLIFCGCQDLSNDWLSYNRKSFSAGLEYCYESSTFTVTAVCGLPTEDQTPRDVTLNFSAPDELKDLQISRRSGKSSMIYDGFSADIDEKNGFFSVPELVTLDFLSLSDLNSAKLDGDKANLIFSSDIGEITVTMVKRDGMYVPEQIKTPDASVKILWINFDPE